MLSIIFILKIFHTNPVIKPAVIPSNTDFSVLLKPKIAMIKGTLTIGIKKDCAKTSKLKMLLLIDAKIIENIPIKKDIVRANNS